MNMADNKREICLLIGNGLNRVENDSIKWDDLIKKPVEQYLEDNDRRFVDIPRMSYPLKFECIVNFLNEESGQNNEGLYNSIKSQIIDELNAAVKDKTINHEISKLLKEIHPNSIITTNYDTQLEKVFASKGKLYEYSNTLKKKMNSEKHDETNLVLTKTATLGKVDFYHMHGISVAPKTICLGYEHYVRIIAMLRKKIGCDSKNSRLIKVLRNEYIKSVSPTYLAKFFNSNVYIVGLGLNEEEIDLWWILCYRAYLYFSNIEGARKLINNRIVYYDVHTHKTTQDGYSYEYDYLKQKEALFKYMHVEYRKELVKDNYKESYIKVLKEIIEENESATIKM